MSRCATCAKPLPKHAGSGRQRAVCRDDHCEAVYYSGHARTRCARCRSKLPKGRSFQRAAICGRCFIDLTDLSSLTHATRSPK